MSAIHRQGYQYRIEPDRWAGIVSIWCQQPQPSHAEVYRQVLTGLKPGGVFLFEASSTRAWCRIPGLLQARA